MFSNKVTVVLENKFNTTPSMESHLENNIAHLATSITSKTYLAKQSTTSNSTNTDQRRIKRLQNLELL